MLQYLHTSQLHSYAYVLENVPPLEDSQLVVLVAWQQIKPWIKEPMQLDATTTGSCAHYFQWLWTNLAPLEIFQSAY